LDKYYKLCQQQDIQLGGAGTQASALAFGGDTTGFQSSTEEFTGSGAPLTKTITVS
jgi:hypothetical protein